MNKPSWEVKVLACPRCGGVLQLPSLASTLAGLVRCAQCGPSPCFAGVPVLVPDPFAWCARFRDAILATLAEHDAIDRETVPVLDAFARGARGEELFADDWTAAEETGAAAPPAVRGPITRPLKALASAAEQAGPSAWLQRKVKRAGTLAELGPGAGLGSQTWASRCERLVLLDRSLRAVLQARRRAQLFGGDADVVGVVAEAEALPLRPRSLDGFIAAHVIDLLDDPRALLEGARRAVRKGGHAWLTTPDPALGAEDDATVQLLAEEVGWVVSARNDGLPWLRQNSARFTEVYVSQALELR